MTRHRLSRRAALRLIGASLGGGGVLAALAWKAADCGPTSSAQGSALLFGETRTSAELARQGYVNDASGLNLTRPAMIVTPRGADDVWAALDIARGHGLHVTMSGSRHCMGGQALRDGAVLLDMRQMEAMSYRPEAQTITVQPGATWAAVQRHLDPYGRAVRVMQSSNIFTIGGSLSVNSHGRDVRFAPLVESVESVDVMLASGQIVHASPGESGELFRHVIGGYGLFGVILQAELKTTDNEMYRRTQMGLSLADFMDYYAERIVSPADARPHPDARLMEARLRIDPDFLFDDVLLIEHVKADVDPIKEPLQQNESCTAVRADKLAFQEIGARLPKGKKALWWLEQNVEQRTSKALLTRNQAMSPPIEFLRSGSMTNTQVLYEYFLPRRSLVQFVNDLRRLVKERDANVIHANMRTIRPDDVSALAYAQEEGLSVVLYVDQPMSQNPTEQQRYDQQSTAFSRAAADAALAAGGTFYMPYRLQFAPEQVLQAYPGIRSFFATKRHYDPENLFANSLDQNYGGI